MAIFGNMMKRALAQMQRHQAPVKQAPHLGKGLPPENYAQQPMNVIQVPDLTRKLVTRYGLREKAPAPTLSPEIVPVVLVDDLIAESDLIRPRIRPCAGTQQVNLAASTVVWGLYNPSGSGVVIHLNYFIIGGQQAGLWNVRVTGTPNTTNPVGGAFRGNFPNQTPAGKIGWESPAVAIGGVHYGNVRNAATNNSIIPWDAVLHEGTGVQLTMQLPLTGLFDYTAVWTEEDLK